MTVLNFLAILVCVSIPPLAIWLTAKYDKKKAESAKRAEADRLDAERLRIEAATQCRVSEALLQDALDDIGSGRNAGIPRELEELLQKPSSVR